MVRLISRQRGRLAALKLTKLFGINDFPAAKDSGKVLIIIIYCYLIIFTTLNFQTFSMFKKYKINNMSTSFLNDNLICIVINYYL